MKFDSVLQVCFSLKCPKMRLSNFQMSSIRSHTCVLKKINLECVIFILERFKIIHSLALEFAKSKLYL